MHLRGSLARSVALLFGRSGLLPRESHSLATDQNACLGPVLHAAWTHLRSTRASIDKWCLYFIVVSYIVTATAFLAIGGLLLVASAAHADTIGSSTSMFQVPDPQQDLAQDWLGYLFLGQDIGGYVSQSGQIIPQAQSIQNALQTALGYFSDAILVVAAIMLFYHLMAMVVETAHHGVAMGKRASQIWAPIRLVVAIGLLVPVSSGLNSGQYIVIKVAQVGSALASNTWHIFLTALATQGPTYHAPKAPYVRKVVEDLVAMNACQLAYNYQVASSLSLLSSDISQSLVQPMSAATITDPLSGAVIQPAGGKTVYSSHLLNEQNICGSYQLGTTPALANGTPTDPNYAYGVEFQQQMAEQIAQAHLTAINNLLSSGNIATVAKNVKYFIDGFPQTTDTTQRAPTPGFTAGDAIASGGLPSNNGIDDLVNQYQTALQTALTGAMSNLQNNSLNNIANQWSGEGWVTAGAWFNTIARSQGAIIEATQDGLPQTVPPRVGQVAEKDNFMSRAAHFLTGSSDVHAEAENVYTTVMTELVGFNEWLQGGPTASATTAQEDSQKVAENRLKDAMSGEADATGGNLMNGFFYLIDRVLVFCGAWSDGDLMYQFTNTANPLAEVAYLGHTNLASGLDLLAVAGVGSLASGVMGLFPATMTAGKIAGGLAAMFGFVGLILIAGGFTLAFFVPLLPFIWFFFNTLTWVLAVMEGVVVMPLVALAHLNPAGEGLPGEGAKQAYFLILNIFLRPVLMVFGLIMGLLLFFIAISFLNMMYGLAAMGSGGYSGMHTVAKLVFSMIYVGLVYISASHCFRAIGYFPENALRWMGASGHHETMGTPEHMGAIMTGVAAYGGKELGSALQTPGKMLQGHAQNKQSKRQAAEDKRQGALEAAETHRGRLPAYQGIIEQGVRNALGGQAPTGTGPPPTLTPAAATGEATDVAESDSDGGSKLPGEASRRAQNRARAALEAQLRDKGKPT